VVTWRSTPGAPLSGQFVQDSVARGVILKAVESDMEGFYRLGKRKASEIMYAVFDFLLIVFNK
jgi:hypothetical protein